MSKTLVPIKSIVPDPDQPRKYFDVTKMGNLKKSLQKHGIINPVTVEKHGDKYLLVDGERRFRAATEIGLKEIPVNIIDAAEPMERMIEQFHIQEMHEGWSPIEKAMAIQSMCEGTNVPYVTMCSSLGIARRTADAYIAMTKIASKSEFMDKGVTIDYASPIVAVVRAAKKATEEKLEEEFLLSDVKRLEKRIIQEISEGVFERATNVRKIGDVFRSDPKLVKKYMEGATTSQLYSKSGAKSVHALRTAVTGASYLYRSIHNFMENPDAKLTLSDISALKRGRDAITKLLEVAGKND